MIGNVFYGVINPLKEHPGKIGRADKRLASILNYARKRF